MVDLFHAIAACGDLIHYWDVVRRADGVLVRAKSRLQYATEHAAADVAQMIAARVQPPGYEVLELSAGARTDGEPGVGWHAFVEVLIGS